MSVFHCDNATFSSSFFHVLSSDVANTDSLSLIIQIFDLDGQISLLYIRSTVQSDKNVDRHPKKFYLALESIALIKKKQRTILYSVYTCSTHCPRTCNACIRIEVAWW